MQNILAQFIGIERMTLPYLRGHLMDFCAFAEEHKTPEWAELHTIRAPLLFLEKSLPLG